jgi:hypothetical protein
MAHGQSNAVTMYAQWAKPASSNALVSICLDGDFNPYNGNEQLVQQFGLSGTTSDQIASKTVSIDVNSTNAIPGVYSLYAKITAGERTRYLYAPELLTLFSTFETPRVAIFPQSGEDVRVHVIGVPGQRVVLQRTADFRHWQPVATNWLMMDTWSSTDRTLKESARFYRAVLQ